VKLSNPESRRLSLRRRLTVFKHFTVYALSVEKLDVPTDSSGAMVVSTAKEHLLGKAIFIAHYGR
jgi:hypothetical protein